MYASLQLGYWIQRWLVHAWWCESRRQHLYSSTSREIHKPAFRVCLSTQHQEQGTRHHLRTDRPSERPPDLLRRTQKIVSLLGGSCLSPCNTNNRQSTGIRRTATAAEEQDKSYLDSHVPLSKKTLFCRENRAQAEACVKRV